jgi:LacI family transcriptional regulator
LPSTGTDKAAYPGVTTYFADIEGMARASVEELILKIENPQYRPTLRIITGKIIVKDSVRPLTRRFG